MFPLMFMLWSLAFNGAFANNCYGGVDVIFGCDIIYGHIIDTLSSIRSLMECSLYCDRNDQCLTVKYDLDNKTCQLNSERYLSLSTSCSVVLSYAFVTKKSCKKLINQACTSTSECLVPNSQCFNSKCQCDPGYSYRYINESCLTSCGVYGSTFTVYSGHRLYVLNDKDFPTDTVHACKQACTDERDFVCRSLEYNFVSKNCQLSTENAVTQPNNFQSHVEYDYYNRNCM